MSETKTKYTLADILCPLHAWILGQCGQWRARTHFDDIPYSVGIQTVRNALERMCEAGLCERQRGVEGDKGLVIYKATESGTKAAELSMAMMRWACGDARE